MRSFIRYLALAAVVGVLAAPTVGEAETAKPAPAPAGAPSNAAKPAPVGPEPGATTATYGDWVLRCQRLGDGDKSTKFCEVAHIIQPAGQSAPLAQVALGHPPGTSALRLTAALPVNLSFPAAVQVFTANTASPLVTLEVRRCLPNACFADVALGDEAAKALTSAESPGKLSFRDGSGNTVTLPLSVRGLAQALAAFRKEG